MDKFLKTYLTPPGREAAVPFGQPPLSPAALSLFTYTDVNLRLNNSNTPELFQARATLSSLSALRYWLPHLTVAMVPGFDSDRGVFVCDPRGIPANSLVCEYTGLVRRTSAHIASPNFCIPLSPTVHINAEHYGNIARFVNHASSNVANCRLVGANEAGQPVFYYPRRLFLFTNRDVDCYEQLCYDYSTQGRFTTFSDTMGLARWNENRYDSHAPYSHLVPQ